MKLGEFLKGVEEAGYLVHVNEGNSFLAIGGYGNVTFGGNTAIIGGSFSVNADLDGSIAEPALDSTMEDGSKYSKTGYFKVGDIMVDVTYTFTKCQCCCCNA